MVKKRMSDLFSIKDKVIIITGAGKGIGSYLAENMAKGVIHIGAKNYIFFLFRDESPQNLIGKKKFKKIRDIRFEVVTAEKRKKLALISLLERPLFRFFEFFAFLTTIFSK